jgi:hypothetical protein
MTTSLRLAPSIDQPIGIPGTFDRDRPLPAEFGPVNRALAGAFTAARGLVE